MRRIVNLDESIKATLERIGKLIADREAKTGDYGPTYECPDCKDLGYRLRTDDEGIVWSRPCGFCKRGQEVILGDKYTAIREAARKRQALQQRDEELEEAKAILAQPDDQDDSDLPF